MKVFEKAADNFIGLFSPRRKLKRQHMRRMAEDDQYRYLYSMITRLRSYRSGSPSGRNTPWLGGNREPDQEVSASLNNMVSRSRELNRDDPIASGITNTFEVNVIGTGIRPQARTDDPDKNTRIEAVFKERMNNLNPADNITYGESQRMKLRKVYEDGNVFIKRAKKNAADPVYFETFEYNRLGPPGIKKLKNKHQIINGIEKDKNGIPVAYHFRKKSKKLFAITLSDYDRIDKESVTHLKMIGCRPGQTLGVPAFHAVLQDLRDLDLLILASLKRTQVAACLAAFITSPDATEDILDTDSDSKDSYGKELKDTLEPGMIMKLYPDEDVKTLIPNFPVPEFVPFIVTLARRIGTALGISWQIVLKDFGDSNFSSARTDLLESRRQFIVLQRWFIEKYLNWEWITVLEDAILRGDLRMKGVSFEDIRMVNWIPNGWQWVDPQKEALATRIKLMIGVTTLRDECASQGLDWEEVQDQRLREEQREQEKRKELGLPEKQPDDGKGFKRLLDEMLLKEDPEPGGNGSGKKRTLSHTKRM